MKCPQCGSENIDWYLLTAISHSPETKIGKCKDCGYVITMKDKLSDMRKKGAFTKYCSDCGETFGSDDVEEFMEMVKNHKCKGK